jgi:hypothetical protein
MNAELPFILAGRRSGNYGGSAVKANQEVNVSSRYKRAGIPSNAIRRWTLAAEILDHSAH